ncbi:hypothetical protein Tco_0862778 [Tanacetum coccineum]
MSATANTNPIVTTVTKQRTKKKRRRKRIKLTSKTSVRNTMKTSYPLSWIKSVAISKNKFIPDWTSRKAPRKDRLRYNDENVFNRLSRLDRAGQDLGILPALEVAPPVETALDIEITSAILKSRTMVSTSPKGLVSSTEDPLETDVDPGARGDGEKTNLHHPADLKAAPVVSLKILSRTMEVRS